MVAARRLRPHQVLAAPLAGGASVFGPAEAVAGPGALASHPSATFVPGSNAIALAWGAGRAVEVSQRPAP